MLPEVHDKLIGKKQEHTGVCLRPNEGKQVESDDLEFTKRDDKVELSCIDKINLDNIVIDHRGIPFKTWRIIINLLSIASSFIYIEYTAYPFP